MKSVPYLEFEQEFCRATKDNRMSSICVSFNQGAPIYSPKPSESTLFINGGLWYKDLLNAKFFWRLLCSNALSSCKSNLMKKSVKNFNGRNDWFTKKKLAGNFEFQLYYVSSQEKRKKRGVAGSGWEYFSHMSVCIHREHVYTEKHIHTQILAF